MKLRRKTKIQTFHTYRPKRNNQADLNTLLTRPFRSRSHRSLTNLTFRKLKQVNTRAESWKQSHWVSDETQLIIPLRRTARMNPQSNKHGGLKGQRPSRARTFHEWPKHSVTAPDFSSALIKAAFSARERRGSKQPVRRESQTVLAPHLQPVNPLVPSLLLHFRH